MTDDCFSSLPPRCSLTNLQLYIHVRENSEVQNGSDIWSLKQVLQNSLVLNMMNGCDFAQSHADFFFFFFLDHGSPQATRTNRDHDRRFFCARSCQPCLETLCKRATSVAHLTNFPPVFFFKFSQKMPLYLFYTMVQKSQK